MINGPTDASTAFSNGAVVSGLPTDRNNNSNTSTIIVNTSSNNTRGGMMTMSDPSMLHAFDEDLMHHHHPHHPHHPHDLHPHSHPHYNYGNIQLLVVDQHVENEFMHEHNTRRAQNFASMKQELSYEEETDVNSSSHNHSHSIAPSSINPFSDTSSLSEISSPSQSRKRRKTNKVGPSSKSNKHLKSSSEDSVGLTSSPTTFKANKPFAAGEVQAIKRQKCDLLKAFFRVYFIEDKNGSVLKDSIYILYAKKIAPNQCIARNAVYRHMWSYFKDKITASQSNYREFINGIRLNTCIQHLKASNLEKDVEILRSGLIENDLFGFTEEELGQVAIETDSSKNIKSDCVEQPVNIHGLGGEKDLMQTVEHLEMVAMSLVSALADLKNKLKEHNKP